MSILISWFEEFSIETKRHGIRTANQYVTIVKAYLNLIDLKTTDVTENLFTIDRMEYFASYVRKGQLVRPALKCFIEFLQETNFITEQVAVFKYHKVIEQVFSKKEDDVEIKSEPFFLSPNDIRNLFGNKIHYKDEEERLVFRLAVALSFFGLFKNEHIYKMKIHHIDLEERTIKNLHESKDNDVIEYLVLDDLLYEILVEYMEYRERINTESDQLIIYSGNNYDENKWSNKIYSLLTNRFNRDLFDDKSVNAMSILKSSMLHRLRNTNGAAITDILLILGKSSNLLSQALTEYNNLNLDKHIDRKLQLKSINELLPKKTEKLKEDLINAERTYSERNDITIADLERYEMNPNIEPTETKITIQRLVRNSVMAGDVKMLYENTCQVCNKRIRKADGNYYSEAHHIQPYNKKHRGDDVIGNLIVLCSNCHTQFDDLYYAIDPQTLKVNAKFVDDENHLRSINLKHELGGKYLEYAWQLFLFQ